MPNSAPIFVVSDLHLGDGGPRDNFAHMDGGKRQQQFEQFLDYVECQGGQLFIAGDLFELWQGNISKVLTCRMPLLDRLGRMGATYLLGNHDIDLKYLTGEHGLWFTHPLFKSLALEHTLEVNGRKILLVHGHEQDAYCRGDAPGIGRISAIYSGLREDRNGSPLSKWKYGAKTVEARSLGRWGRLSCLVRRCLGRPNATSVMRQEILQTYLGAEVDAVIYGHTHEPGRITDCGNTYPIYNCGTWAESVNTFAAIEVDGTINLWDWIDGKPRINCTELPVS